MWLPWAKSIGNNNSKSTAAAVYIQTYHCKQETMPVPTNLTTCESQGLKCWYTLYSAVSQKKVEVIWDQEVGKVFNPCNIMNQIF